jgi:hypothetical protein
VLANACLAVDIEAMRNEQNKDVCLGLEHWRVGHGKWPWWTMVSSVEGGEELCEKSGQRGYDEESGLLVDSGPLSVVPGGAGGQRRCAG